MASNTLIYYLPFYFQSAKGVSAENSGLSMVPYLASLLVMSLAVGGMMMVVGHAVPFMWFGSIISTIASGLLSTLRVNSSTVTWAGYQVLAGIGFGSTLQVAAVAIQAALPARDLPTGNALLLFSVFLGSSLSVSIAQNIFFNVLEQQLEQTLPQINITDITSAGATAIPLVVPPAMVVIVQEAYNYSITKAFILSISTAGIAFFCTFGVEWRNVRKERQCNTDGRA